MKKITKAQAAYIAGFFDGEGCICCADMQGVPRLRVTLVQQNPEALYKITKLLGCGNVHYKHTQHCYGHPSYVWCLYGKTNLLWFIKLILPYAIVKQPQLELGIELLNTYGKGPGYPLTKAIIRTRQKLAKKLRS